MSRATLPNASCLVAAALLLQTGTLALLGRCNGWGTTQSPTDISCPNFFKLGNKWVLVCISHRLGCRYFIGDFKNEQFLPEQHALIGGMSNRYFAPESLLTPDGRRVNWAWFFGGQTKGVQSLPMEMELPDDGIMRFRPVRDLESLRYNETSCVIADKPREAGAKINNHIALFSQNGDLTVDKLTGWQMKSAFEGDTVFKGD